MMYWKIVFYFSLFVIFFNYAGYALIVWVYNKIFGPYPKKESPQPYYGTVSFIVAAYNEESCIEAKILNCLKQDYPASQIEWIFITDGSTDGSNRIIERYPQVKLLYQPARMGKTAALNRAVAHAAHDILIFSDANTLLNADAVTNMVRHYANPEVGGVAGEKKVLAVQSGADEVGAGEGLYWKYESVLKKLDSDFYSVVGAAGELFSLRKNLYQPVGAEVILDDFVLSMKVAEKGYRYIYEPAACAQELPSYSLGDEKKRKVRIAAGGFQAIGMLPDALRFWKHPRLSYLYISHRILRWTLSPLCMILLLMSNIALIFNPGTVFYQAFLLGQVLFYSMGVLSLLLPKAQQFKVLKLPHYFIFMNVCVVLGFFRFLAGNQTAVWEKARRMA